MVLICGMGLTLVAIYYMLRRCKKPQDEKEDHEPARGRSYSRGEQSDDVEFDVEMSAKETVEDNF